MEKREICLILVFALVIALNIFWLLTYNKPDKSTLTAFISLKNFIWNSLMPVGRVFITIGFYIDVKSPQNTTYYFSKGVNYTIDLNVSTNRDSLVSSWWYTLIDLKHNTVVQENMMFTPNTTFPNTTFNAVRWSNKLIVYVNDTANSIVNSSVTFFVYVSNSNPLIENITPEIFVCEGEWLSHYFNVTDVDEETPTSDISQKNPFYVAFSSAINLTENKYEIYSGTLNKNHAGGVNNGWKIYEETISAYDNNNGSDAKQINITVIEINNVPSIEDIGVQTVWAQGDNRSFYRQTQVTDTESGNQDSGNLTFNITILNSTGSVINLFNLSSNCVMNFTANSSYIGVYNITLCVRDKGLINSHPNITDFCGQTGSNTSSCESFSLTVTNENRQPTITSYYPLNLSLNISGTAYFNVSTYDPDGTIPDAYWYIDGVFQEKDSGSSVDEFTHNFCGVSGERIVKVVITDDTENGLNDSAQWDLTVSYIECPSVLLGGGGGGGGGAGGAVCDSKWGYDDWSVCRNVEKALKEGNLSGKVYRDLKINCSKNNWDENFCGFQARNGIDVNNCSTKTKEEIQICYYTEKPTCDDGIKNCHDLACEVLVDCGGPCLQCQTCSDRIKNQGEEEADCGGPCPVCPLEKPKPFIKTSYVKYTLIIILTLLILFAIIRLINLSKTKKKIKDILSQLGQ